MVLCISGNLCDEMGSSLVDEEALRRLKELADLRRDAKKQCGPLRHWKIELEERSSRFRRSSEQTKVFWEAKVDDELRAISVDNDNGRAQSAERARSAERKSHPLSPYRRSRSPLRDIACIAIASRSPSHSLPPDDAQRFLSLNAALNAAGHDHNVTTPNAAGQDENATRNGLGHDISNVTTAEGGVKEGRPYIPPLVLPDKGDRRPLQKWQPVLKLNIRPCEPRINDEVPPLTPPGSFSNVQGLQPPKLHPSQDNVGFQKQQLILNKTQEKSPGKTLPVYKKSTIATPEFEGRSMQYGAIRNTEEVSAEKSIIDTVEQLICTTKESTSSSLMKSSDKSPISVNGCYASEDTANNAPQVSTGEPTWYVQQNKVTRITKGGCNGKECRKEQHDAISDDNTAKTSCYKQDRSVGNRSCYVQQKPTGNTAGLYETGMKNDDAYCQSYFMKDMKKKIDALEELQKSLETLRPPRDLLQPSRTDIQASQSHKDTQASQFRLAIQASQFRKDIQASDIHSATAYREHTKREDKNVCDEKHVGEDRRNDEVLNLSLNEVFGHENSEKRRESRLRGNDHRSLKRNEHHSEHRRKGTDQRSRSIGRRSRSHRNRMENIDLDESLIISDSFERSGRAGTFLNWRSPTRVDDNIDNNSVIYLPPRGSLASMKTEATRSLAATESTAEGTGDHATHGSTNRFRGTHSFSGEGHAEYNGNSPTLRWVQDAQRRPPPKVHNYLRTTHSFSGLRRSEVQSSSGWSNSLRSTDWLNTLRSTELRATNSRSTNARKNVVHFDSQPGPGSRPGSNVRGPSTRVTSSCDSLLPFPRPKPAMGLVSRSLEFVDSKYGPDIRAGVAAKLEEKMEAKRLEAKHRPSQQARGTSSRREKSAERVPKPFYMPKYNPSVRGRKSIEIYTQEHSAPFR